MLTDVVNPLELQRSILEFVMERQAALETVSDAEIADGLDVDLPTLRVHLEMLAAECRLGVVREDDGYRVFVTDEQRARHEAPPPHVVAREKLERVGSVLERVQDQMNRILAWAPLALALAGGALGWFSTGPAVRAESALFIGVFGLIVGVMIRKELVR